MLGRRVRLTILYDFYGPLLTARQRQAMELHCENDLSLTEVAVEMKISRQAAFDLIKRTEKTLESYEDKLGLVQRFDRQREDLEKVHRLLAASGTRAAEPVLEALRLLGEVLEIETSGEGKVTP